MLRILYSIVSGARAFAITVIFAFIIVLCLVQIFLRYFTTDTLTPYAWGDEIIRLSSVWVVFLAASLGVRESSHLSVDFFIDKLFSHKSLGLVKRIATVIVLAVLAAIIYYGIEQTKLNFDSSLENLAMSRAWFYAAIPVGCAYLFLDYALILAFGMHPFSRTSPAAVAGGEG